MPVFPGAHWEPIPGHTDGPMQSYLGLVLHVNDANSYDLHDYFSRSDIEVSSHFQVGKDGKVFQYLDTDVTSWCQSDGNQTYLSVETQGFPNEKLTNLQVTSLASLYRWLHDVHNLPYQIADKVGAHGFAWHGMGGTAWGGHFGCPGELRKAQRQAILNLAQDPSTEDDDMTPDQAKQLADLHNWLANGNGPGQPNAGQTLAVTLATVQKLYNEVNVVKASLAAIENKLGV